MKRIETTLSDTDHTAWEMFCHQTGKSSASLLREFIQQSITSSAVKPVSNPITSLKSKKITIGFTQHEFDLIISKIALEDYQTPTNWLRCLVMSRLHHEAVLTHSEIQALEKLSYQLWAIGHNLNQATRALNIDPQDTDSLKLEMIQDLKDLNLETRNAFSALIAKNKSRWYQQDKQKIEKTP